jgi:hypothetical protein
MSCGGIDNLGKITVAGVTTWIFRSLNDYLQAALQQPSIARQGVVLLAGTTEEQRSSALSQYALSTHYAGTSSLDTLAQSAEFEASLVGSASDTFMREMSDVFGHEGGGLDGLAMSRTGPHSTMGRLDSTGFASTFQDTSDQVHHAWYYVQLGYYYNPLTAHIGNWYHETIDPMATSGKSAQDWSLGWEASFIGQDIAWKQLLLYQVGDRFRQKFGTPWSSGPVCPFPCQP